MRVRPFLVVTANSVRTALSVACGSSGVLICVHAAPPLIERQRPCEYAEAYMIWLLLGSRAKRVIPRAVPLPSQTNWNVWPPSFEWYRPFGGRGSGGLDVAPAVVDWTPRTARPEPTQMLFGLSGSATIELIALPANALPLYVPSAPVVCVTAGSASQVWPPSVDFQMPMPAPQSPHAC